ncbi:MAG: pantetheine-phosphate adenylyltransferase [Clostridia bacterium]|nr:pantetheine-phosphate adenylyltransferase [Clostridia bacterium]
MSIALIPGSFDPFTLGHVDLVERAARLFDRVVVAVMVNGEKSGTGGGCFTFAEREALAAASLSHLPNVEVISDSGLLVELAQRIGATTLVKGVRGTGDFDYEYNLARINRRLPPTVETLLLPADSAYDHISATMVRDLLRHGRSPEAYLHPAVAALLKTWGKIS